MYKVLIAEDEKWIRTGLAQTVDWAGLGFGTVLEAPDGNTALELALREKPEVILSDIKMPQLTGLELAERLRREGSDAHIILISGFGEFSFAQRAIHLGVTEYLLKPIDMDQLLAVLRSCVRQLEGKQKAAPERPAAGPRLPILQGRDLQKANPGKNIGQLIQMAIDYIQKYYYEDISMNMVAQHLCVNPSYFSHVFSEKMGIPFIKYLNNYRIAIAKQLLADPTIKVYEVANLVGFDDYRYFSKTFKKIEGVSPDFYRNVVLCGGDS